MKQDEMELQIKKKVNVVEGLEAEFIKEVQNLRLMVNEYVTSLIGSFEVEVPVQTSLPAHPLGNAAKDLQSAAKKAVGGYDIVCDQCGGHDTVKFKPNPDWEVLCKSCFKKKKGDY